MTLRALYTFTEGAGTVVHDTAGFGGTPSDFDFQGVPTWSSDSRGRGLLCGSVNRLNTAEVAGESLEWTGVQQMSCCWNMGISGTPGNGEQLVEMNSPTGQAAVLRVLLGGDMTLTINDTARTYVGVYPYGTPDTATYQLIFDSLDATPASRVRLYKNATLLAPTVAWDAAAVGLGDPLVSDVDAFVIWGSVDDCQLWYGQWYYDEVLTQSQLEWQAAVLANYTDAYTGLQSPTGTLGHVF